MGEVDTDCSYDGMSSKPNIGRDITEDLQSRVVTCKSKRCMTCTHMVVGDTFVNNVNGRTYYVIGKSSVVDCSSKNVVYLISCNKCGVKYVGKTSQTLRSRLNNHRNRIKNCAHTVHDISIMPIEEVVLGPEDNVTLASKLLDREDFWMRELRSVWIEL